jgi:hypothetical protein
LCTIGVASFDALHQFLATLGVVALSVCLQTL